MKTRTELAAHYLLSLPFLIWFGFAAYFVAIPTWQRMEPSSNWLEVHSVMVDSGFVGTDRPMHVRRTLKLKEPTRGIWTAKVTDARGVVVCYNTGTALYKSNSTLPLRQNFRLFDWWMDDGPDGPKAVCSKWPLPAGWYTLSTQREFFPRNYPTSKVVDSPDATFLYVDRPSYLGPQSSLLRPRVPPIPPA